MAQDPLKYFRIEARELLEQLGKAALDLEAESGGAERVQRLLRLAHTLKGASRVVKQKEIADHSHAIEDVLAPHRQTTGRVPREVTDAILKLVDQIGARVTGFDAVPATAAIAQAKAQADDLARTVRAEVAEVDGLLDGLTEAHVQLSALRSSAGQLQRVRHLGDLLAEQLANRPGDARSSALLDELRGIIGTVDRSLGTSADQLHRELRQTRDAAEHLRLIPASTLFTPLQRTVRDIAQALEKEIVFEGHGGTIRIDAHVLAAVQPALVQLARNAAAHGIEVEAVRRAAGKPAAGRFVLSIRRRGRKVVFSCRDDGAGIDVGAVRRAAVRKGLTTADAERLETTELIQLLLKGGISTSASVTEVSGRGIGLDIVREAMQRLSGDVQARTQPGTGTEFELTVPLSLASVETLSVEDAGLFAAVPLDSVRRSVRVAPGEVTRTADGDSLVFEGRVLPFISLQRAIRPATISRPANATTSAVILEAEGRLAALGVDRLIGVATVVLRPLPELTAAGPTIAGAFLDAEGNPQLVLDADGIIDAALHAPRQAEKAAPTRHRVLVVDDSLTTRMLEQSILESAGYEVDTANSGEEGLEKVVQHPYSLILVDVEMPGIDGFTFVERLRADAAVRHIPAILVTSRNSPEDKGRGERVGANGYIVKSEFDQVELLARIRRLVER